ncbi:MAG: FAD-dependent oxidoreductase [Parvularculaceae bacterium]|nr:FAD-dependent oxidoreductase [Parvularculaceae bacterium]
MTAFDEVFDFAAAGSGGGALCASLVLRKAGKSVVVLEKTPLIGGATARSGGVLWIPNNPFLKRDGIADSPEKAALYLDTLCGDRADAPGATRARRLAYIAEAPRMLDFLIGEGIRLNRVSYWPDYYDDLPGGLKEGRTVVAEIFNVNELGAWKDKLRPGFLPVPASLEEALKLPYFKQRWDSKKAMAKVAFRSIGARLTGKQYISAGQCLQGRMLQAALKAGADIRTESPVEELLFENGRVVGVRTVKNGRPWRIGARLGVLVNAGGFARNQRMRDRYQPGTRAEWSSVPEGDTGEMIEEMMRHGAAIAQMEEMVGYQTTEAPGFAKMDIKPTAQGLTAKPHAILVDQSGVRYMNEGGSYMAYCKGMLERNKTTPAIPSWAIFDAQYLDKYMLAGTMPGRKKPESWAREGYLRQAATIEELARLIKVDPAALAATVARFNGFVDKGHDEDFRRGARAYDNWLGDPGHAPSQTLGRIEKPPFCAVPVVPGDVGTYGGVVTDVDARVLRENGTPIEGLYATGVSTASVMGRAYPGAGSSIGPSFTFGYIAAKHAAGLGNQP